jgi:undecaprenyl-diphosphatase
MDFFQAIVLGIVQGATEFIPISSSGHLVLVPWLFGWPDPGLAFDTMLHLGTLVAVLVVFWQDFRSLAAAVWRRAAQGDVEGQQDRVAWWIVLGTIPAALMGFLWEERFEALFRSPLHVSVFLLVTGLWLTVAEYLGRKERQPQQLHWWESLLIGLAQGCAIAPGISRSGATIGAGMLLGLRRDAATRFSFLLATPIIIGAGLLQTLRLLQLPDLQTNLLQLVLGFAAAFVSGYGCIRLLLSYVRRRSLIAFSIYCWLVGIGGIVVYSLR